MYYENTINKPSVANSFPRYSSSFGAKLRLSLSPGQELEDIGIDHTDVADNIPITITSTLNNGSQITTDLAIQYNITENFPPELISITNKNDQSYMSASLLELSSDLYSFQMMVKNKLLNHLYLMVVYLK